MSDQPICGAKPPEVPDAPGCAKIAGHTDDQHVSSHARWPNRAAARPLSGRAYVEDLERRAAERDVLAHDLETTQRLMSEAARAAEGRDRDWQDQLDAANSRTNGVRNELAAEKQATALWMARAREAAVDSVGQRVKAAALERDNQRLEEERDGAREGADMWRQAARDALDAGDEHVTRRGLVEIVTGMRENLAERTAAAERLALQVAEYDQRMTHATNEVQGYRAERDSLAHQLEDAQAQRDMLARAVDGLRTERDQLRDELADAREKNREWRRKTNLSEQQRAVIWKWRQTMSDALGLTFYPTPDAVAKRIAELREKAETPLFTVAADTIATHPLPFFGEVTATWNAEPAHRCGAVHPDSGTGVACTRDAGHPDDHYNAPYDVEWYAGDVTCASTVVLNDHMRSCDLPQGHPEPHRATGLEELTWR